MFENKRDIRVRRLGAFAAAIGALCLAGAASASIPNYSLVGTFDAPGGVFDLLPDGRIVTIGGANSQTVLVQDAVNGSTYSTVGTFNTALGIASFGPSFLAVSADGQTLAIGDNNFSADASVYTVSFGDLGVTPAPSNRIITPNFDGAFAPDGSLYVTGADAATFASGVTRVAPGATGATLVIDDLGGGSAGITINDGVLYTGNGFDTAPGGSDTGEIRAVDLALLGGAPVSFESGMTPVGDALSAASLGFDPFGNLLVGGGDFFGGSGDLGYAGIIDAGNIASALGGGGFSVGADLQLDPVGGGTTGYSILFNDFTQELLVSDGATVYRYAIPAPGAAALLALGGLAAARRRRA